KNAAGLGWLNRFQRLGSLLSYRELGRGNSDFFHGSDEPVSASRKRLNVARFFGRVAQCCSKASDGIVQAVIEIHEGVGRPDLRSQFFACDQLAGTLEQHRKNEQWLPLKSLPYAAFAELKRAGVQLKNVKTQQGRGLRRGGHG